MFVSTVSEWKSGASEVQNLPAGSGVMRDRNDKDVRLSPGNTKCTKVQEDLGPCFAGAKI